MDSRFLGAYSANAQLPEATLAEVAVAGRSNCGKSSLINALCGRRKLARTSSTPGRTRELVFFALSGHGGPPIRLVDLPGYGYAKVSRDMRSHWGDLISGYIETRQTLGLMLVLMDIRREASGEERDLLAWMAGRQIPALVLLTKADKLGQNQRNLARLRVAAALAPAQVLVFSIKLPETVAELRRQVAERTGGGQQ